VFRHGVYPANLLVTCEAVEAEPTHHCRETGVALTPCRRQQALLQFGGHSDAHVSEIPRLHIVCLRHGRNAPRDAKSPSGITSVSSGLFVDQAPLLSRAGRVHYKSLTQLNVVLPSHEIKKTEVLARSLVVVDVPCVLALRVNPFDRLLWRRRWHRRGRRRRWRRALVRVKNVVENLPLPVHPLVGHDVFAFDISGAAF
jgi:hypothetical protein